MKTKYEKINKRLKHINSLVKDIIKKKKKYDSLLKKAKKSKSDRDIIKLEKFGYLIAKSMDIDIYKLREEMRALLEELEKLKSEIYG